MKFGLKLTTLLGVLVLSACTSVPVDQATVSKIKSVTITKLYLPEFSYLGRDGEAAAKRVGVTVGYLAFGVLGMAASDAARAKSEQPYRDAIKAALSSDGVNLPDVLEGRIGERLKAKAIGTSFIDSPAKLGDGSGLDFGDVSRTDDYVLELIPFQFGFTYGDEASTPNIDVRWRLLERYPNGKLIELNRGSIYYRHFSSIGAKNSLQLPTNTAYSFPGHVSNLTTHGSAPKRAMRDLTEMVADVIVTQAFPSLK